MLRSAFLFACVSFISFGCGSQETKEAEVVVSAPVALEKQASDPVEAPSGLKPFRQVVLHEVPEGEQRPPDETVTGKSVGKLYELVAGREGHKGLFDQVRFVDSRGRKLRHHALLRTSQGDVRIELLDEAAPTHVRNFIALSRAGYYDGLPFHKSVREQLGDRSDAYLEAGCPLGSGELGYGSIGYWLRPEIVEALAHEEGVVGAWHGLRPNPEQPGTFEDVENAACKFYIGLTRSPWRDLSFTIFGKVVQGLEVAHRINHVPNHVDPGMRDRPREPVVIRQVIIEEAIATPQQVTLRD